MAKTIQTKRCSKCKKFKPISEYHKNRNTKDGLHIYCKPCRIIIQSNYQKTDKGKATYKKYAKSKKGKAWRKHFTQSKKGKESLRRATIKYQKTPKGKAYQKNYHQSKQGKAISRKATNKYRKTEKGIKNATQSKKQWRINNPKHNKANRVVQNAVRYDLLPNINTLQCSCGHKAEHYHHWYGYEPEHWFDIIAVCYGCHLKYHNNNFNP